MDYTFDLFCEKFDAFNDRQNRKETTDR
jgi:hypothetical protein